MKPRTALIAGGGILAAALAYFWWRSRQSASSAATTASASASAYSDSGQLDELQAELAQLLGEQSGASGGGGSSGGGTSTTPAAPGTPGAPGAGNKPVTTLTPPTAPKAPTAGAKPKPAMPSARETKVTSNSVTLSWAKVPNATSYRVRVTYQGKLVGAPHVVAGTSATISGLGADRTYTFHVAAIGPGGTSAETNGPAVKTSR
jgi:hypothetical protein